MHRNVVEETTKPATILAVFVVAAALAAGSAGATAELCVGSKPGCFQTIQAAVDAANDGDTIRVSPGTFAGGITITKSVSAVGAGAGATVIEGGGPVITIGALTGPQPTVSISRVTITGGLNDSSPGPAVAAGGGMRIGSRTRGDRDDRGQRDHRQQGRAEGDLLGACAVWDGSLRPVRVRAWAAASTTPGR